MLSGTRWSARYDAVSALSKGYDTIGEVLESLFEDQEQSSECRGEADGLLRRLQELETAIFTELWENILVQFQKTNLSLQKAGLSLNTAVHLLESLHKFVDSLRPNFDQLEQKGIDKCGHGDYKAAQRRIRTRNRRYDDGSAEDTVLQPRDKFRVEVFLAILDRLTTELTKRITAYKEIHSLFGFIANLVKLQADEITTSARNLVKAYPHDLEESVNSELVQFSVFLQSVNSSEVCEEENEEMFKELHMYLILKKRDLTQTFPNVEIALRIYLCMMASNCSGERSFSKLGRIKNEVRSTMGQMRLNMLSIMSIENEILRSLEFTDIIDEFAAKKVRKRCM